MSRLRTCWRPIASVFLLLILAEVLRGGGVNLTVWKVGLGVFGVGVGQAIYYFLLKRSEDRMHSRILDWFAAGFFGGMIVSLLPLIGQSEDAVFDGMYWALLIGGLLSMAASLMISAPKPESEG